MTLLQGLSLAAVTLIGAFALIMSFFIYSMFWGRGVPPARPGTCKVACVGDSITYGDFFRASKRYPPQLESLLGSSYSVRNFGASGHTAQETGDYPYRGHRYFRMGTEFAPDIVVIMLGTNDSKPQNWKGASLYEQDIRALVHHYQSLPSHPRVVLATPPSTFLVARKRQIPFGINAAAIAEMAESVRRIGADLSVTVADIHAATAPHPEYFAFDGIHPGGRGAQLIAETVYRAIAREQPVSTLGKLEVRQAGTR